jgi:hypothetical protein
MWLIHVHGVSAVKNQQWKTSSHSIQPWLIFPCMADISLHFLLETIVPGFEQQ